MKDRICDIIIELEDVCRIKNLKVTDEVMFIQACTFIRGEQAQKNKGSWNKNKEFNKSPTATKKQIDYLSRNNIDHNAETITKQEAFILIKEHKEC